MNKFFLNKKIKYNRSLLFFGNSQSGVAVLPIVIALTILVLSVGVSMAGISLTGVYMSDEQKKTSEAYSYAEAGAKDALIKIARNKNYTCNSNDCYLIDTVPSGCSTNRGCARVSVSTGIGSVGDPKIITSKGETGNYLRKVQVSVVFDGSLNGEISSATWQEVIN